MSQVYEIRELPADSKEPGFQPYGAAAAYWKCKASEAILSGAAETGKTRCGLEKLNAQLWKYAGAQAVIVRKVRATVYSSVLQTYEKKVLGLNSPVKAWGGKMPEWYDYPNGSRLWVAGMDNAGKALSSERDYIYGNQFEEFTLDDYETLLTRATGRAGNVPYPQVGGDCNPSYPKHWIKSRESKGELRLFESRHEDNPTLFDPITGLITEQGRRTMKVLDSLTGVRLQRLRFSRWVAAEGVVFEEFDASIHVIDRFDIPKEWRRIRSIDFGYTNPFVCQWWAIDPDGRMFMYREIYKTRKIVSDHAIEINRLSEGETYEATIADHDAEDRATLDKAGIATIAAFKSVSVGIQATQDRLRAAGDGKARMFFFRDALVQADPELVDARKPTCLIEEMDVYMWPKSSDGKPLKEEPLKENDHSCDTARYAVAFVDQISKHRFEFSFGSADDSPKAQLLEGQSEPDGWMGEEHLWITL